MAVNLNSNGTGDIGDAHTYQVTVQPSLPSGIAQNESGAEMTLFPNPVVSDVNVKISMDNESQLQLSIIAADGKLIKTQAVNATAGLNNLSINLSELNAGIYMMVLSDDNKKITSKSFVKF